MRKPLNKKKYQKSTKKIRILIFPKNNK